MLKNQELSQARKEATDSEKLLSAINRFERKLALVEEYGETEEIRYILRKIAEELPEFTS